MSRSAVAGIDIGTTAVKGVVITADSVILRTAYEELPRVIGPGCRIDPSGIVAAVKHVAQRLWPFDALGVAGMANTHLLVDDSGRALTTAVGWNDYGAFRYAPSGWSATSALARVRQWQAERPAMFNRARWLMLPRDYALFRICDVACTDPGSWPDLLASDGDLNPALPTELQVLLPPMRTPQAVVGEYRGVPVVTGCMDSVAAVLGSGPTPVGVAIDVGGSSETAGAVAAAAAPRSAIRGVIRVPEGWWHAGPTQAGGRSLDWAAGLLAEGDRSRFLGLVLEAASRPTDLIFLPYLEGERAPVWDRDARAALAGMSLRTGKAELARAVLEGVAFSIRHVLEAALPEGLALDHLVVCGRPASFRTWNQIKADVTGLECFAPREPDTGARGAAMLAYAGLTQTPLAEVRAMLAPERDRIQPESTNVAAYDRLYARYLALWPAIRDATADQPLRALAAR